MTANLFSYSRLFALRGSQLGFKLCQQMVLSQEQREPHARFSSRIHSLLLRLFRLLLLAL